MESVLGFSFGTKYDSTALSNCTDIFSHILPPKITYFSCEEASTTTN